jgi:hypothetical protein
MKISLLSPESESKLTKLALNGELKALKMILDLIQDKQNTSSGSRTNFIRINNTKIDSVAVK